MSYLVDHGYHTRLVLGLPDGGFVEYGYGEWLWYARMQDQWWRVTAVLLWPTQGALARREWRGSRAEIRLLHEYGGLTMLEIPAETSKVDALLARLDREFSRRYQDLIRNEAYGLDFVPYDQGYWLLNNSNHAVKGWLEELGYEVTGSGTFARWTHEE